MASIAFTINPRIVRNGGPITSDVYKSHATTLWLKGTLLKFASGLLTPVVDTKSGAAEIDTDDTGTAVQLFVALEDHIVAGTDFVAVQEILSDTVLEMQLCASSTTSPATAAVTAGTSYAGYQLQNASYEGSGLVALDVDDTTTPVFRVVEVSSNYKPFTNTTTKEYAKVLVKVLPTIVA